ncbi:MAG: hypothetical protein JO040_03780 [Gemmatimonadetes bacterium]|nr:hypothetical protein [Gemmatimonadota bacterium]
MSWRLLPIVLPLLSLVPAAANSQQSYELRCRGNYGSDFNFHPAGLTLTEEVVAFRASPKAAGADGSGLAPGTCSWIDRPLNQAEPREIWFNAPAVPFADSGDPTRAETAPSKSNIALYLYDESRYWSFFVYNTNRGHFKATSYRAWHNPWSRVRRDATTPVRAIPRVNPDR